MLRRISSYFLLVACLLFIAVKGTHLVRSFSATHEFTHSELFDLIKMLLVFFGAAMALYNLRRDRAGDKQLRTIGPISRAASAWPLAFARRPVTATLAASGLFLIPVGLLFLSIGGRLSAWTTVQWELLVLMELPFLIVAAAAVAGTLKRPPNNRWRGP